MNQDEKFQAVFRKFQQEHGGDPRGTHEVVTWAVRRGLLALPVIDAEAVLAERMAQALRNDYATDPATGRRYRRNHNARYYRRGIQYSLWANLDDAPPAHMHRAFQQRRKQIVGDCAQLKTDVDVYNGRNADKPPIQLVLDFTDDVSEIEAAAGYSDEDEGAA